MASIEEAQAWIRLSLVSGVGSENQRKLLARFHSPQAIFSAPVRELSSCIGAKLASQLLNQNSSQLIEKTTYWLQAAYNQVITLADAEYPQSLLQSDDPPLLLYVKGDSDLLQKAAFAIVGSRNASVQGVEDAQNYAASLAKQGLAIVSGLALGIDSAAHQGALKAAGSTVAVIGTGIDRIYPASNSQLAHDIAEHGVIVSEFPLGSPPLPANFPRRNRIIAALSLGCLVVEATERSGSLITARLAAENGREVFAIPGSIHSPLHKGCHRLIKQGAKLVESAQDILEELRWPVQAAMAPSPDSQDIQDPLWRALTHDPCTLDTLAKRTGLNADELLSRLLPLELAGKIAQLPGGRYQRLN